MHILLFILSECGRCMRIAPITYRFGSSQSVRLRLGFVVFIVKINLFELIFIHFIGRTKMFASFIGIDFSILFRRVAGARYTACNANLHCASERKIVKTDRNEVQDLHR